MLVAAESVTYRRGLTEEKEFRVLTSKNGQTSKARKEGGNEAHFTQFRGNSAQEPFSD